jgi:hypothetical protein
MVWQSHLFEIISQTKKTVSIKRIKPYPSSAVWHKCLWYKAQEATFTFLFRLSIPPTVNQALSKKLVHPESIPSNQTKKRLDFVVKQQIN